MASKTREQMIDGTVELLARGGMPQTSFATVLERTGSPRGSIYHHFPKGKDQLVSAAVETSGARSIAMIRAWRGDSAALLTEKFLAAWRQLLTAFDFTAGCAVLAVTTSTESDDLLDRAAEVFRSWRAELASLLTEGGLPEDQSAGVSSLLIASVEGAVVMCRAEKRIEPFDDVAAHLLAHVSALARDR